jgi:peptidoglycan/xylan/chitin deacetylase (PgdA/CDA1 family)
VGLHLRIIGRPGRAKALDDFIAYARAKGGVWFARRNDIATAWREQFPPPTA